jgi:CRISPR-associated protein Csn2
MRMSIMGFENKIEFKEGIVNVFEIYNQKLFSEIINTINNQCNGEDDDNSIVLMENEKRLNIEKTIYLLTDLFNIDFNSKKILNKIYGILIQNIQNRQDEELGNINLKLRNYLIEEINELPFEFNMNSEIDIEDLLKTFNVKIDTRCYTTIIEKVEFIISIISTLKIAEILVIPN